ncbi:hypothetical protein NtRootA4_25620 [Arthrobacter sp. NtRootA4]|nr:hypothetical protein NtRootA2_27800 [Arthrobacter sp. NtRootA2]BCW15583.1 hypothetical protein NtRootA4_25620 [Arthrobacter sp. NtRootA4]BCW23917.1 hypothetical protein NtRootC7_27840 [Arthrobacter sp. NtRootC7]BCW28185.1 hypothetical protein NtRootC45_27850 [Arthrobacter sp. NtRootC45]BCW32455.1 hypothetical protein NtRootD5_27860 [Arthrobacter sp. NtRootD5]
MVINIKLSDRTVAETNDPLGRSWYGYDPEASAESLWANNRGDWSLDAGNILQQRWVALNYQGRVVLVAELLNPDHTVVTVASGRQKKALLGRVLTEGHAIHDALIGMQVSYPAGSRNSIWYGPDPEPGSAAAGDASDASDLPDARGQGVQMDAAIRRTIENAAQDRLMKEYRDQGWTVTDTRLNSPYDALAVKGTEKIYLEAKGTQSQGKSVILTRNEVKHARLHPGTCVIGIWSGMRLVDGEVDPSVGDFRVLDFNPASEDLNARDFDWTLPGGGGS